MENLKPIPEYEGYAATADGRAWSLNFHMTGKIRELKARKGKTGYLYIMLCKNGKKKKFSTS